MLFGTCLLIVLGASAECWVSTARMKPLGLLEAERDRARFLMERTLQAITRFAFISPLMGMFL